LARRWRAPNSACSYDNGLILLKASPEGHLTVLSIFECPLVGLHRQFARLFLVYA
jgi:hypothetical protein